MPIVASQHSWKDSDHEPLADWPEDCTVQWGGRGVVISQKGNYGTAFFEAFPKDGGFIRGEGPTIVEAESDAMRKFIRKQACDHLWGRGKYTNGGCICRRCGSFETRMKSIPVLGAWRAPLNDFEIESAIEGWTLAPGYPKGHPDRARDDRYRRKTLLRIRMHGIQLPDPPADPIAFDELDDHPYIRECRDITCRHLVKTGLDKGSSCKAQSIETFMRAMSRSSIRRNVLEWCRETGHEVPDFAKVS